MKTVCRKVIKTWRNTPTLVETGFVHDKFKIIEPKIIKNSLYSIPEYNRENLTNNIVSLNNTNYLHSAKFKMLHLKCHTILN